MRNHPNISQVRYSTRVCKSNKDMTAHALSLTKSSLFNSGIVSTNSISTCTPLHSKQVHPIHLME